MSQKSADQFKSRIVDMISRGRTEQALHELSGYYAIPEPKVRVGMVKGHSHVAACYVQKRRTIYASDSDAFCNPFVILHEFYHHLRAMSPKAAGTERLADSFAKDFLRKHAMLAQSNGQNPQ